LIQQHFFFFNLYLPTAVVCTLYALTSREDPRDRPVVSTSPLESGAVPSFMMHLPPSPTELRTEWMLKEEDETRASEMIERQGEGEVKEGI
jgi:hypothetical protein